MQNPIYVVNHKSEKCDYYYLKIPWTHFKETIHILCKVSQGYDLAKERALNSMIKAFKESIKDAPEEDK